TRPMHPVVLSMAAADLEDSARILAEPAGFIRDELAATSNPPGNPSPVEMLIALAIRRALESRGVAVDAVLHGTFSSQPVAAGQKTIADAWAILPYENFVVTGEMEAAELAAVMEEVLGGARPARRSLAGLDLKFEERGAAPKIAGVSEAGGRPVGSGRRLRLAMNTYDAAGGGQRLMRLREIMARPAARAVIHPVQTREALIDFLRSAGEAGVGIADLRWPAA
ncbi:MAG: 5'-nucleotidase C-terminal domain-containing protein, partial [Terrimicrobiaceae bacterium]|nr:5'-nucleotidase C-terminal domain-containing protein [Terrimicrobiaceae bacterium]